MLFYRAIDASGRLRLAPSQEAARKINPVFDSWEFPAAKAEIMEVLQDLIERAEGNSPTGSAESAPEPSPAVPEASETPEASRDRNVCPKCKFNFRQAEKLLHYKLESLTIDGITSYIMELSGSVLGAAAGAVASRFQELARSVEGERPA